MFWLVYLATSLSLAVLGSRLQTTDEVYGIALYAASLLLALWGWSGAPAIAQISLGCLALGWVRLTSVRT